jgi:anthranilate synthase component I
MRRATAMRTSPDRETFRALARTSSLVPVWCERLADLDTPVSAFAKVAGEGPAFLLESVQGGERWAAYSFVGYDPLLTLVGGPGGLEARWAGGETRSYDHPDPLVSVEEALSTLRLPAEDASASRRPRLVAGAVGYLGYDVVRAFERLPETTADTTGLPAVSLMVPTTVLVFDTLRQVVRLVRNVHVPPGADADRAYDAAREALAAALGALAGPVPPGLEAVGAGDAQPASADAAVETADAQDGAAELVRAAGFTPGIARADFEAAVTRVREHVLAGDCIQTVLSQRFTGKKDVSAFDVYRALRTTNPSPYMYFLRLPTGRIADAGSAVANAGPEVVEIAGASPEVLVRVAGGEVAVRPIAGTRPRGSGPEADAALEAELRADPKEVAEHVMLVDLGRNDVGRIAEAGSVRVAELMIVERYSHVMHLVSEVRGRLAEGRTPYDVIRACFPAGTLSGAPKVRAMEIIEDLEPIRRSVYGGAVGYVGLDGAVDLAICIRTLVAHGDTMWVQAGAGIVADSVPEREYMETINKATAVLRAVELARGGLSL